MTNKVNYIENNLRKIMVEKGMSQKNLAYCIGVTYQQVHKYVKGTNQPNFQILMKMAEVLNCKIREIYPLIDENELVIKNAKNVTIQHNYCNSFWSKVFKMDMNLLRNKIVFITVTIGGIFALVYMYLYPTLIYLFNEGDQSAIERNFYYYTHLFRVILAIILAIVYTLTFKTTLISYVISIIATNGLVFQLYHVLFGVVGESEVKRTLVRLFAIVVAIIWVRVAARIREKV